MKPIYEPTGMAREYSPLALNIYMSCLFGCKYCYVPRVINKRHEDYFTKPAPRKDLLTYLRKQLEKETFTKQVWLSFVGDVYGESEDDNITTREVLKLLNKYKVPVAVITKAGTKALRDLDVFKDFDDRIMVGTTLTFLTPEKSKEWEPDAAMPQDRLELLRILKANGIKTHASFEPVVEIEESLKLIELTAKENLVDHYKIGKINNYKGMDKGKDWEGYLNKVLAILRPANKEIYVKCGIRALCPNIKLTKEEMNADEYALKTEIKETTVIQTSFFENEKPKAKIFTSYYATAKSAPKECRLFSISIDKGRTAYYSGESFAKLAPPRELFAYWKTSTESREEKIEYYIRTYNEMLSKLNPHEIAKELGENAVLLCYEKPSDFCHRHLVAKWLTDAGIACEEISFKR